MTSAECLSPYRDSSSLRAGLRYIREEFPARIAELEALESESSASAAAQARYIRVLRDLLATAHEIDGVPTPAATSRYESLWEDEDRLWTEWSARLTPKGAAVRFMATKLRLPGTSVRRARTAA